MASVMYKPMTNRFQVPVGSCSFNSQFAQIYTSRLAYARPSLEMLARRNWKDLPIRSLADLTVDEECVIIGTIYKQMLLKPSIIKQLAEMEQGDSGTGKAKTPLFAEGIQRLTSENEDETYLEDEVQRICLHTDDAQFSPGNFVTGVVVAIRGLESDSVQGFFTVKDVTFLEPKPEHPIMPLALISTTCPSTLPPFSGPCLVLVSGLGFMGSGAVVNEGHQLALQLFGDWLREGGSGMNIARLIILGDSIRSSAAAASGTHGEALGLIQQARFLTRKADADSVTAMALFDTWLSQLPLGPGQTMEDGEINGLPVDILPGPSDCVSHMLPQQPLHAAMFPKAIATAGGIHSLGLRSSTNPCVANIGARKVLATSGQGVTDIIRYTTIPGPLEAMEASLRWGHLAPTCPDTLYGYPLRDRDLLLFRTTPTTNQDNKISTVSPDYPDVFAVGNQTVFGCRRCSDKAGGALLVSVPRFDTSQTVAIVELASLRCLPLRFQVEAFQEEDKEISFCIDSSIVGDDA